MELHGFFQHFYASHYVPVALFREGALWEAFTPLDKPLDIYREALPRVAEFAGDADVFSLSGPGLYGLLRLEEAGATALLGPVFDRPVTEKMVADFARQNGISSKQWSVLYWLLAGVPRYTYNQFSNLLLFLHFTLNGRQADPWQRLARQEGFQPEDVRARQAMRNSWEQGRHETYLVENALLALVRAGDLPGLERYLRTLGHVANLREGPVADTPLRQAKNIFLGFAALVGKTAAIPGGMDEEEAYGLIDLYSQECERAGTVEAVKLLQFNMLLDFTQRVAQEHLPGGLSPEIARCVRYLRAHFTEQVGIDEAAVHLGKSRAWLTRQFKAEMGQSLGEYLTHLRMEEAKRLLLHTDLNLSEIALSLGISSQAYFQTVFKKAEGLTPAAYRKEKAR